MRRILACTLAFLLVVAVSARATEAKYSIKPTKNADVLNLFKSGKLDGGWEPEPYASRMVLEGKGHVLVDERDLWPGGKFTTTNLVGRVREWARRRDRRGRAARGRQPDGHRRASPGR